MVWLNLNTLVLGVLIIFKLLFDYIQLQCRALNSEVTEKELNEKLKTTTSSNSIIGMTPH